MIDHINRRCCHSPTLSATEDSNYRDGPEKVLMVSSHPDEPLILRQPPILRWSNPEQRQIYGNVFLWTHRDSPAVVGSLFKWFSPFTHMSHVPN